METGEQDTNILAKQYDKQASKFNDIYFGGKQRGREAMSSALDKTHEQMVNIGEYSEEQGRELKQHLARDLDQTIARVKQLGEEAKDRLNTSRLGAGALSSIATALELTSDAIHSLSSKAKETLTYKTGEMTSAGTLMCKKCGQKVYLKETGHIPPCPNCSGIHFEKGY